MGERTLPAASAATLAAAALLLKAQRPVISVNGNTAALVGRENLFHRRPERERVIARYLRKFGAKEILGVGSAASKTIGGISSPRAKVDPNGIGKADVVLIPLEDGDRAEALDDDGKKVIAVDLNPLSRTSQVASISIVDNVVRAIPALVKASNKMTKLTQNQLEMHASNFNNDANLANAIEQIIHYLKGRTKN